VLTIVIQELLRKSHESEQLFEGYKSIGQRSTPRLGPTCWEARRFTRSWTPSAAYLEFRRLVEAGVAQVRAPWPDEGVVWARVMVTHRGHDE
jgi:hypothetical protein